MTSERNWSEHVRALCSPRYSASKELYDAAVDDRIARVYLEERLSPGLPQRLQDPHYARHLHQQVFDGIYKTEHAGQWRTNPDIRVGDLAFHTCDPQQIPKEMGRLSHYKTMVMEHAEGTNDKAIAIATGKVQLERVQPFIDGNGRISTLLVQLESSAWLGVEWSPRVPSRGEYRETLEAPNAQSISQMASRMYGRNIEETQGLAAYDFGYEGPATEKSAGRGRGGSREGEPGCWDTRSGLDNMQEAAHPKVAEPQKGRDRDE